MKTVLARLSKHLIRRGQVGQSLVILAIGFVGLLGFVGIVTDVSLLFVRYSSLRRAVDAAAVAAAGQMRRVADDPANSVIGEAASVATLNLAARQFIEVYGLDPSEVIVETCRAQQIKRNAAGQPTDELGNLLYLANGSPNPAAVNGNALRRSYEQLCTRDELKLVRVTAQIQAPTVFLRLLGYDTITLTESAISQTAVLDLVLIFDVSESMLADTTYDDWEEEGRGVRYMPPVVRANSGAEIAFWDQALLLPHTSLNTLTLPSGQPFNVVSFDPVGGQTPPGRDICTWRAWPFSAPNPSPYARIPTWLQEEYITFYQTNAASFPGGDWETAYRAHFRIPVGTPLINENVYFRGFVPNYNYFGCCNDPNGDGSFADLVCQPFKQARDAAEGFLSRLDFLRGDRVAFVTFDRTTHLVDPDGTAGAQLPFIETEYDLMQGATLVRRGALPTLQNVVGVRAEPSFYSDSNGDGRWDNLIAGGVATSYAAFTNSAIGTLRDHPVLGNCPFDTAATIYSASLTKTYPDGSPRNTANTTLMDDILQPLWLRSLYPLDSRFISYDYVASCSGGNIGGALAESSNVLVEYGRREGTVWIMVLLSDGAAGGSNVTGRYNGGTPRLANAANPYFLPGGTGTPNDYVAQPGEYGGFGLCPYGTEASPGELADAGKIFPYCSDKQPETRTYCSAAAANPDLRAIDDPANLAGCQDEYDVDDYARDWADWIGLANLPGAVTVGGSPRVGEEQLPTIFTIGFGLNYDIDPVTGTRACAANDYNCQRGIAPANENYTASYLGEELLRYIADVGDNFRIDDDYWQFNQGYRIPNRVISAVGDPADWTPDWGQRGPCQQPLGIGQPNEAYAPLPPRQSCGNYYAASSQEELDRVFNEIASRMFTRLAQ